MNKEQKNKTEIFDLIPALCLILGTFIIIYIFQLGVMPLLSQDEVRYAEVAREMIASGNWTVPCLNGIHYFEKPALGHWMNAVSEIIFGGSNFSVRFASALCTGLSALCLFFFLRRFTENKKIALIAPLIFLTSGLVLAVGTFSVLDAQVSFFLTAAMMAFYLAYQSEKLLMQFLWLFSAGIMAGLAFLTKGFLAYVVTAISILPFLIWEKSWKRIFTMPWIPFIASIFVILPWGIKINEQSPDFWHYFVVIEHYERFIHASKYAGALHPQPFWFFVPILIVGALPWFFHLPGIFIGLKDKDIFSNPLIRYCVTWTIFPFIFFSLSSGKLATYILPCFPPLVILISYGLYKSLTELKREKLFNAINSIVGYFLLAALAGAVIYIIVSCFFNIPKLWNFRQLPVGILAIFFWAGLLFYARKVSDPLYKIILLALAPILAMSLKSYLTPESALANIAHEKFIQEQSEYITPGTTVMAYQDMIGAACWYLKRDNVYVYGKPGELEYWLGQPEYKHRFVNKEDAATFIGEKRNNPGGVVIFLRAKDRKNIPVTSDIDKNKGKVMFSKFEPTHENTSK